MNKVKKFLIIKKINQILNKYHLINKMTKILKKQ